MEGDKSLTLRNNKNAMKFRIEYKEDTGQWHHERASSERSTDEHGWVTILEDATTKDAWLFECLVEFATGQPKGSRWSIEKLKSLAVRFPAFKAEKERLSL